MPPEALAHLQDVCTVLQELAGYMEGISLERYLADSLRRRAVERCLSIAGEALIRVRRTDAQVFASIPNAQKVIGMRNVLAHEYGEVSDVVVWEVLHEHLSALLVIVQEQRDRLDA